MRLNGYEKVIIRDVKSKDYKSTVLTLRITFLLVSLIFLLIYFYGFHADLISNFKYLKTIYLRSILTLNEDFGNLVYTYNKAILFLMFINAFFLFLCLAFFAYDIMSRNRVIKYYQNQLKGSLEEKNGERDDS